MKNKIKNILVWIKNLITPLTFKAAKVYLEKNGYKVTKK